MDAVTVVEGRLQRLEDHCRHAAAENRAVGFRVEGPAMPRLRDHRARLVGVADVMRYADRRGSRQCEVALAGQQALAGEMHGDQRRRTSGLHRHARPAQVQLMRHPARQVVLVVEQHEVEHLDGDSLTHQRLGVAMGHQVVHQIAAGGAAGERTDRPVVAVRVVPGILEGVPCGLQEKPLLRVHHAGGVRVHPEVFGVELVDPVEQRCAPHVGRVGECRGADSGGGECLLGKRLDRLFTGDEVLPELRHRVGTGEPDCHADDGDRVGPQALGTRSVGAHTGRPFRLPAAAPWRAFARCWARAVTPGRAAGAASQPIRSHSASVSDAIVGFS